MKVDKNSKYFSNPNFSRLKVEKRKLQINFPEKQKRNVKATKNFSKYANIGVEMQPDGKAPLTAILSKVVTLPSGKKVRLVIKAQSDAEIRARHKETNEIAEIRMGNPEVYNGKYEKRTPFYMEHLASKQKLGFSGKNVQLATIAAYRPEITNEMVKKSLTEYVDKACTKETKGKYHDEIAKNRDKFTVYILLGGIGSRYKPTCAKGLNKPADPAASEFPLGFLGGIRAAVDAGLIDKEQAKKDILSGNIAMANVSNPENKPNGKENTSSILMLEGSFGQNTSSVDGQHISVVKQNSLSQINMQNTFETFVFNRCREDFKIMLKVEEKPKEVGKITDEHRKPWQYRSIPIPEDVKNKNSVKNREGLILGMILHLTGFKVAISQTRVKARNTRNLRMLVILKNFKNLRFGDPNFSIDFRSCQNFL